MKNYIYDDEFYTNFYPDIKNKNIDALDHYVNHGKGENRVCCREELKDKIVRHLSLINDQYKEIREMEFNKPERKINILIRTSMRPELFKTCIHSVLTQKYENYHVYVCYDKIECYNSYLSEYDNSEVVTTFYIEKDSKAKFKFNLYNNDLMDRVKDGFIIFLDDDDMFAHKRCLQLINDNIVNNRTILIWKFMRPDKLVYPKHVKDIKLGEIDTTSVCFNYKYRELAQWGDKKCGDYRFYTKLFNKLKKKDKFNYVKLNYILTKTIYYNKKSNS